MSRKKHSDESTENGAVATAAKESKRDRFLRLAPRRMDAALKRIRHIANLSSRSGYDYTDQESDAMMDALADAVGAARTRFAGTQSVSSGFKF